MNKNAIAEHLRAVIANEKKRSKAAQLKEVIDEVETALAAGVSRTTIVNELAKCGLEMKLVTFDSTLKRIRQKRGKTAETRKTVEKPTGMVPTPEPEPERVIPSHDPRDLDAIMNNRPDLEALSKFAKRTKK